MSEVREGLICPKCMQDLGTIAELSSHFDTVHQEPESIEALASLKDIFTKAKKKFLNEDRVPHGDLAGRDEVNQVRPQFVYNQLDISEQPEPGFVVVHTGFFRQIRSHRLEGYNMQMNKLIIRLGKLLAPGTPIGNDKQRRDFEQKIVKWLDGNLVSRCPRCAGNFTPFLGRRKHHCRLCGAITCQDCSEFVDNNFAQQLLQGQIGSTIPVLQLRCCKDCFKLLLRKQQVIVQGNAVDHVEYAYTRMREVLHRCIASHEQYILETHALIAGESSLSKAQELRAIVVKLAEKTEVLARKIGDSAKDPVLHPRSSHLRGVIRTSTTQLVKYLVMTMPRLPEAEELERLAQQRREEARKRVERPTNYVTSTTMVGGGWTPSLDTCSNVDKDEDPLKQQIRNIKRFLEQARAANRMDEVAALAENLRQLEIAAGVKNC